MTVDRRLNYDSSIVRQCKKPSCKQWHRIWTMLDHDIHKGLKKVVRRGRFRTQQQLVEHILTQYVNGFESRPADAVPAMRSGLVQVDLADLEKEPMDGLKEFRDAHGLSGQTRSEIISSAVNAKWIKII